MFSRRALAAGVSLPPPLTPDEGESSSLLPPPRASAARSSEAAESEPSLSSTREAAVEMVSTFSKSAIVPRKV
jgi:hypothetical protein